jgi:chemosensory pili system protein ChpA (sensor histidine kinase/response regulator)
MTDVEKPDYATLRWVKEGMEETILLARQALEEYVGAGFTGNGIHVYLKHVHQLLGTLRMVQVYGAGMLAEEMERVARLLADGALSGSDRVAESLMLGLVQLPPYLQRLEKGEPDIPLVLLPVLNDLRALRGIAPASEVVLYAPNLDRLVEREPVISGSGNKQLPSLVRGLRNRYHKGLLLWYRDNDLDQGLHEVLAVVQNINAVAGTLRLRRLMDAAEALVVTLIDGEFTADTEAKQLFSRFDRALRRLIDEGEEATVSDFPTDLLKSLLYFVSRSHSSNPVVQTVKRTADLANSFPDQIHKSPSEAKTGADESVLQAVAGALLEDLLQVKEVLDLYIRGDREETHRLRGLGDLLLKAGDTLGMLGRGVLREKLAEVAEKLSHSEATNEIMDDEQLMQIATVIVEVESSLVAQGSGNQTGADSRQEADIAHDQETEESIDAVIQEAFTEFSHIKTGVERYLRGTADASGLIDVAKSVHKLIGVFEVAKLSAAANLMQNAEPILHELAEKNVQLDGVQQSALVDLFAGIEYYLEARLEKRSNLKKFTDYAEEALLRLTSEEAAEEAQVHPEFEEQGASEEVVEEELFADSMPLEDVPEDQLPVSEFVADDVADTTDEAEEKDLEEPADLETAASGIEEQPEDIAGERPVESTAEVSDGKTAQPAMETAVLSRQMDEIDPDIFDIFMEEASEELEVIQSQYPLWKKDTSDEQVLQNFRRSFHTLKGSGRMVGAHIIGEFSWVVENLLNRIMEGSVKPNDEIIGYLDDVIAAVPVLIDAQAKGSTIDIDVEAFAEKGFALADGATFVTAAEVEVPAEEEMPDSEFVGLEEPISEMVMETEEAEDSVSMDSELEQSSILLAEDLVEIFKAESSTHLAVIDSFMSQCDHCIVDTEVVRAVHTLHGSSHLAEVVPMAMLAGEMEQYCKHLHQLSHSCDRASLTLFARFREIMQKMLDAINTPGIEIDTWEQLAEDIRQADHALPDVISELQLGSDSEVLSDLVADPETQEAFLDTAGQTLEQMAEHVMSWQEQTSAEAGALISKDLCNLKQGADQAGLAPLAQVLQNLEMFFGTLRETGGEVDEDTKARAVSVLEDVESALDMLHLNGKLPDMSSQIEIAKVLAHGMGILSAPDALLPESEITTIHEDEDPESILLSESWNEEGELVAASVAESPEFEPVTEIIKPDVDAELLDIFLEEAAELSEQLEEYYSRWEHELTAQEPIDGLMRNLHTLKGNARFAGIFSLGDLSHSLESLFENLASGDLQADAALVPLVRQGLDALENSIEKLQQSGGVPVLVEITQSLEQAAAGQEWQLPEVRQSRVAAEDVSQQNEASSFVEDVQTESSFLADSQILTDSELFGESELRDADGKVLHFPSGEMPTRAKHRPPPLQAEEELAGKGERVRVLAELLDHMVNNAGEVSIYRARLEQHNKVVQSDLQELNDTIARLRKQLRALELETEAQIRSRHEREAEQNRYQDFDPLEMDQYSTLQQLSRALSETINDLSNIGETLSEQTRDADTLMLQQARVTNDLQDGLLRSRMVPFNRQASRLQRVVRQTAQNLGKQAELDVIGAEGEIDRTILNRIMGPLEHLLRNAVAHGIEPPEQRAQNDKPKMGKVSLVLSREGTEVVLTISDDGAGLDSNAIRRKAIANGLLEAEADVNEDALYQFILQPGFTTATEVTQVAGRGVGMDAVVSEIKQLGGSLEILSQEGRGSSFVIRLPFTLAISEALLVQVADEVLAIPHGSAEVIIRASRKDLIACYKGNSEGIEYNGHLYPVRYLGAMLGISEPVIQENIKWYPLLLVRAGEQRMAIQLDNLLGNYQVVVKSIGAQLSGVRWFTGGTILADGKIALLLDVNALVRSDVVTQATIVEQEEEAQGITVMVVDDSITVRKVTSRLLERHNMNVLTARDGVDAITVLQEAKPDIMLLDIEMPRMDGYELARHIRNTPELADIPIIMITSRTGQKHRERAMELGVNGYLGKPYQETDLLENIYTLLAESSDA